MNALWKAQPAGILPELYLRPPFQRSFPTEWEGWTPSEWWRRVFQLVLFPVLLLSSSSWEWQGPCHFWRVCPKWRLTGQKPCPASQSQLLEMSVPTDDICLHCVSRVGGGEDGLTAWSEADPQVSADFSPSGHLTGLADVKCRFLFCFARQKTPFYLFKVLVTEHPRL